MLLDDVSRVDEMSVDKDVGVLVLIWVARVSRM
jgi:hypothetical protein